MKDNLEARVIDLMRDERGGIFLLVKGTAGESVSIKIAPTMREYLWNQLAVDLASEGK